jgi:coiled-coil domain-containing protein 12
MATRAPGAAGKRARRDEPRPADDGDVAADGGEAEVDEAGPEDDETLAEEAAAFEADGRAPRDGGENRDGDGFAGEIGEDGEEDGDEEHEEEQEEEEESAMRTEGDGDELRRRGRAAAAADEKRDEAPKLRFRSYTPKDPELRKLVMEAAKPFHMRNAVQQILSEFEADAKRHTESLNIAPKASNWDLKRELAPKLAELRLRTVAAIAELRQARADAAYAEDEADDPAPGPAR